MAFRRVVVLSLIVIGCSNESPPAKSAASKGGSAGSSSGTGGGSGRGGGGNGGTAGNSNGGTSGTSGGAGRGGTAGTGGDPVPTNVVCTQFIEASASLSDVTSAINSAAPGSALCIERGARWEGQIQVRNAAPTPTERVTVCAGTAGESRCTTGGAANPRIDGSTNAISFAEGTDGFIFSNIDVVCGANCADSQNDRASGVDFAGASNIRFEGGAVSGWGWAFICNPFSTDIPCDGIEIGARDNLTEIFDNDGGFFGWLTNSFVRINAHDNGDGTIFSHHFYLSSGPQNSPSSNVVFEDGYYTRSSVDSSGIATGTFINISGQNTGIVIRRNLFEDSACSTYVIDCGSGGEDPEEFCDGIEISGNTFDTDCSLAANLESTQHARIFNNVFYAHSDGRRDGMQILFVDDGERPAEDTWVYNNTVYCPANCGTSSFFTIRGGTENRFVNNLIHFATSGQPLLEGGCSAFGSNVNNNFLYAPQSSPRLPNCGTGNSTSFNTEAGFADAAGADFHITSSSSAAGFGISQDAPAVDYDGNERPNPPAAGAFDVR